MKNILITGFSSGIGEAIYNHLKNSGYTLYGIGRKSGEIICDLRDTKKLEIEIKNLLKKTDIDILINCAGLGIFKPHEEIGIDKIEELIDVNLKAPIILTKLLLKSLKKQKGHIINISSIEATKHSRHSALYSATKAGLRSFSLCLFEELRKAEVRVTNVNPDITKTPFFNDLGFSPSDDKESYIDPKELAKEIEHIIKSNFVTTDITIRAQKFSIKKDKTKKF